MNTMSTSKLGGICLLSGGILGFIPFALQIMVGGPPEEGAHIFSFFCTECYCWRYNKPSLCARNCFRSSPHIVWSLYTERPDAENGEKK